MKPQQHGEPVPHEVRTAQEVPESELIPLLIAWDQAHPDAQDPEWRHVLDELAHPRTTRAFHRLADTKA
ncbi:MULTISPECIES: hypothetical protein [unclassified Streptomyces]|jgi:hypothetical protein|uniref:hypothetical protein n=1 Tax=unclassified Streptomyces TaxID=2593676 RepID=UPI0011545B55|nr:hypothetical protein [Streptomyces sp. SLBN-31]TQJ75070.1 hypothetical protein FBY22_8098 [Streptomyces sp. SLBN-31]